MADLADPTNYGNAPGKGPLRPGGSSTSVGALTASDANLPSTPNAATKRQANALAIVRDLWGGTEKLRECGATYLPKHPAEEDDNYKVRLNIAVLFNAYRRTVAGLTGLVFAKDPKLGDDVPPQIEEQYENLDNAGTHGDVLLRDLFQDALQTGHAAILVDHPMTNGTQTSLDEQNGVRPYWVPIKKDDIVSWRTVVENGAPILAQFVVKECTMEPAGDFGEEEVVRYRVLYRQRSDVGVTVGFRLLRVVKTASGTSIIEDAAGLYPTQDQIPVAEVITSGRRGLFDSDPPLMDLAYLNIAHYQERSDYAFSKHMTCVPILGLFGFPETDEKGQPLRIVAGPAAAIRSSDPTAKAEYITHGGEALGEVRQSLEDLKSEMGTLGLAMLAPQKRQAETVEAKRLDKATSDSDLATAARGLQDALEQALYFHSRYLKLSDGGSIDINRNYDPSVMEPDVMLAYVALARDLGLPLRVVLDELKAGGRLGSDVNIDELEGEMVATAAANEAQKKIEDAQRMEALKSGQQQSKNPPEQVAA